MVCGQWAREGFLQQAFWSARKPLYQPLHPANTEQFGNKFPLFNAIINAILRSALWDRPILFIFPLTTWSTHITPLPVNWYCHFLLYGPGWCVLHHLLPWCDGCSWQALSQGKVGQLYFRKNSIVTFSYFGHGGPEWSHELDELWHIAPSVTPGR